jgi:hypothetical protein
MNNKVEIWADVNWILLDPAAEPREYDNETITNTIFTMLVMQECSLYMTERREY